MSVLDELREQLETLRARDESSVDWQVATNVCLNHALTIVDDFEAAHPGIVDQTLRCGICGYLWVGCWREPCPKCGGRGD